MIRALAVCLALLASPALACLPPLTECPLGDGRYAVLYSHYGTGVLFSEYGPDPDAPGLGWFDQDGDGFDDMLDACPAAAETPNGILDADGYPDETIRDTHLPALVGGNARVRGAGRQGHHVRVGGRGRLILGGSEATAEQGE